MALEKLLNDFITLELVIGDAQNFESLLSRYETALNSQTFFCHLLPALVTELLHRGFVILLVKILEHFLHALFFGKRSDHLKRNVFLLADFTALVANWRIHLSCMLMRNF